MSRELARAATADGMMGRGARYEARVTRGAGTRSGISQVLLRLVVTAVTLSRSGHRDRPIAIARNRCFRATQLSFATF
jgi:hypothetical protein